MDLNELRNQSTVVSLFGKFFFFEFSTTALLLCECVTCFVTREAKRIREVVDIGFMGIVKKPEI